MLTSPQVPPIAPVTPRIKATPRLVRTLRGLQRTPLSELWRTVVLVRSLGAGLIRYHAIPSEKSSTCTDAHRRQVAHRTLQRLRTISWG
jgi:hypothetical protein